MVSFLNHHGILSTGIRRRLLPSAQSLKADEVVVQFVSTFSTGPFRGETLLGGFSYSTTDPLETSINGVNSYALSSPEDSLFLSFGGVKIPFPLSGATAIVAQALVSFDNDPNQDYFAIQDFSDYPQAL